MRLDIFTAKADTRQQNGCHGGSVLLYLVEKVSSLDRSTAQGIIHNTNYMFFVLKCRAKDVTLQTNFYQG